MRRAFLKLRRQAGCSACTPSLAITQVFILRERRMVGWLLGELCVTKVVSSSSVLDIVSKLPVGSGTSAKSVMKSLGGAEEVGLARTGSNMSCPPSSKLEARSSNMSCPPSALCSAAASTLPRLAASCFALTQFARTHTHTHMKTQDKTGGIVSGGFWWRT